MALILVAGTGCLRDTEVTDPKPLTPEDPKVALALAGLRAMGGESFEVIEARPERGWEVALVDGQDFVRRLYLVELAGRLRYRRDVLVPTREQLNARVGDPDWTLESSLADLERIDVLGAGSHAAASEQSFECNAVLDYGPSGWRFRNMDRRRGLR